MTMPNKMNKTVTLGPEYDTATREALRVVLKSLGASAGGRTWGVGGSQEIEEFQVSVLETIVTVESETYVGLTITGDADVVDKIATLVRQELAK